MNKMESSDVTTVLAKALFAFSGKNNDELSFSKNDMITITQQLDGGWWEGTFDGLTGWFPSNYVEILAEKEKLVRSKSVPYASALTNGTGCTSPVFRPDETPSITNAQFRAEVLKELEASETAYIKKVIEAYEGYLLPIKKSGILCDEDFITLACNMDKILALQKEMLSQIEGNIKLALNQQRIGGIFMQSAGELKSLMLEYCRNHPRAVEIVTEKNSELRDELSKVGKDMKDLVTGLSEPFRHLEKYPIILQELERCIPEGHADRGDVQRSCSVFKEIKALCEAARKQKETQLEFLYTRQVEKWASFEERGKILYIGTGTVVENENRKDRCVVLFSQIILVLEITAEPNLFNIVEKFPTAGYVVRKVEGGLSFAGKDNFTLLISQSFDVDRWIEALGKANGLKIEESSLSSRPPTPQKTSAQNNSFTPTRIPDVANTPSRTPIEKKLSFGKSDIRFNHELGMIIPEGFEERKQKDENCFLGSRLKLLPFSLQRQRSEQKMKMGVRLRKEDMQNDVEDAFLLQIIEGYAKLPTHLVPGVDAKPQIIVAENEKILVEEVVGDELIIQEKSLVDTVYSLKDQLSSLRQDISILQKSLEKEQSARKRLEDAVSKQSTAQLSISSDNAVIS